MPQPKKHENQEWFHLNTTREQAEMVLLRSPDGSYLVRVSENNPQSFVVSFTLVSFLNILCIRFIEFRLKSDYLFIYFFF